MLSPTDALLEWFRANGGYLHENVEIRRQNHEDSTSPYGVFAKSELLKGEIVLKIPSSLYLQLDEEDIVPEAPLAWGTSREVLIEEEEKAMDVHFQNTCKLAHLLRKEMELYEKDPILSKFAPFLRYLNETQPRGQIPATYSPAAKSILREMQGIKTEEEMAGKRWFSGKYHFHPVVDWIDEGFVQKGCMEEDDLDTYHTVMLAIQRGYDTEYIPIWDMLNHDNGRVNIDSTSVHEEGGFQAWTSEVVGIGQELFVSYNYCRHCIEDGTCDIWGLPGIFRDFGFVEDYPQQWTFPDQDVFVLIEEVKDEEVPVQDTVDNDRPRYRARYFQDATFSPVDNDDNESAKALGPNTDITPFFQVQLDRLSQMDIDEQVKGLTAEHERYMITRYYRSLVTALKTILLTSPSSQ